MGLAARKMKITLPADLAIDAESVSRIRHSRFDQAPPWESDQCPNTSTIIVAVFSALRL
jgi:hypothetical protein